MVDDVARSLCKAAGRMQDDPDRPCQFCLDAPCEMWPTFRNEAREAILAAYRWHKRERRWPAFVKE